MSKKNRRALRRSLLTLSLVLVVAFAAVGGTIAWLTSTTETVKNTFTVGKVEITLDEAKVNPYGKPVNDSDEVVTLEIAPRVTENAYKLLPGHTYTKDPTVHVTKGSEPCWVFVQISNGLKDIVADDVTVDGKTTVYDTIEEQIKAKGWKVYDAAKGIYYQQDVNAFTEAKDLIVFEKFTLTEDAAVANYAAAEITITAYAVQADGITKADDAWSKCNKQAIGTV